MADGEKVIGLSITFCQGSLVINGVAETARLSSEKGASGGTKP